MAPEKDTLSSRLVVSVSRSFNVQEKHFFSSEVVKLSQNLPEAPANMIK